MTDSDRKTSFAAEREPDLTASDPYRVLGVAPTDSQVEIKRAYFALIRQYPPETEAEKFKIIRAAYEKLKDVQRRGETDIFRPQPPPAWQPPEISLRVNTAFYPGDVLLALRRWGELGRTDFQEDFKEIDL
ncbi:MAG: J domain-containing protein [Chloroflexota bacterium]